MNLLFRYSFRQKNWSELEKQDDKTLNILEASPPPELLMSTLEWNIWKVTCFPIMVKSLIIVKKLFNQESMGDRKYKWLPDTAIICSEQASQIVKVSS